MQNVTVKVKALLYLNNILKCDRGLSALLENPQSNFKKMQTFDDEYHDLITSRSKVNTCKAYWTEALNFFLF